MDLAIPDGMGGREAMSELLKIDRKARAIVSSGYSNDPVMSDCQNYGFKYVMPKPYKMRDLETAITMTMDYKTLPNLETIKNIKGPIADRSF